MDDYTKKTPWAVAAAFGFLVSHIAQLPGLRRGYRKVDRAIKRYDAAMAENAELKERLSKCEEQRAARAGEVEPGRVKNWLQEAELSHSLESGGVSEVIR